MSKITGADEMAAFLKSFPGLLEKNVLPDAMTAAANVILAEARQQLASNGNVKTGTLSRWLKVSAKDDGTAQIKATGKHAYIAHFLEFTGARAHQIKAKDGKALSFGGKAFKAINHPGFRARPFMRPAGDAKAAAAADVLAKAIDAKLESGALKTAPTAMAAAK